MYYFFSAPGRPEPPTHIPVGNMWESQGETWATLASLSSPDGPISGSWDQCGCGIGTGSGVRQTWIQILPLTLTSCVALGKLLNLLEPHFLYL